MKKNNKSKYWFIIACFIMLTIISITYISMEKQNNENILDENITLTSNKDNNNESITMINSTSNPVVELQEKYQNNDIKAILQIENTNLSVPVVQTTDNEYYLTHNYKKEYDKLGSIYADYRVNLEAGRKILLFGHSSTKTKTPFNTLENYYDKEYYQQHKYITLQTNTNTYRYEIFSVYVETNDFTYMNLNFNSTNDWYLHILKLQKKSLYKTDVELMNDDDILILQTCSTNPKYKKYQKKYLLIVSRRVK